MSTLSKPPVYEFLEHNRSRWSIIRELTTVEIFFHALELLVIFGIWDSLTNSYGDAGYYLVAYLGINMLFSSSRLLPAFEVHYRVWFHQQFNPLRWGEYIFSSSLMVLVLAKIAGIDAVWLLALLYALNCGMIATGYLLEKNPHQFNRWYFLGLGFFGAVWAILGRAFFPLIQSGGWSFGFCFGFVFLLFTSFGVNSYLCHRQLGWYRNYYSVEISYILLSLLSKSGLVWGVWYLLQTL